MSDGWDGPAGDSTGWNIGNNSGVQQNDGDQWGTSTSFQGPGNDENVKPHDDYAANEHTDEHGLCHNCGSHGHFARECPNPDTRGSRPCYNCGQEGHNAADCPEPRKCRNCGKEGHERADCPETHVLKGACRICNEEGHHAANCPTKPPTVCKNCKDEGHLAKDCKGNRKFDTDDVPEMSPEEAWASMKKANDEKDLDDFREAFRIYSKAAPNATFVDIETKMREENFNIYTCALEKQPFDVLSLIDLQGQLDRKYVAGFYFSDKPNRKNLKERWPANAEENLERLANAGFPYDRGVVKCRNCGEMGHIALRCKQDKVERLDAPEIRCVNCNGVGHRVRDCNEKRRSKFGCRNCGSEDHQAVYCPEPRSASDVECRNCGETGHFAKDCPQGGGAGGARSGGACHNCGSEDHFARDCDQPRVMKCRNCDQPGHSARECPEPKDWSKVQCNQCGEMGHTIRRCPQATVEDQRAGNDANGFSGAEFGGTDTTFGDASGTGHGDGNQGTWGSQTESSNWGTTGAPDEQDLSQKMPGVGFEAQGETQEPQYGW